MSSWRSRDYMHPCINISFEYNQKGLLQNRSFMEGPGNEKGVRAFTELLRRSYSFILYQW